MLLVVKRRRMALQVALVPLLLTTVGGVAAAEDFLSGANGRAVLTSLLAGGMLGYVVLTATHLRSRAHTLVVRSLLAKQTFDARAAAFGVAATYGEHIGATYTVYVTDGMRSSDVAKYATHRAVSAANRLSKAFAVANRGGSAEARGLVTREIAAWKAAEAEGKRPATARYALTVWKRRLPLLVGLGLALYVAALRLLPHAGM